MIVAYSQKNPAWAELTFGVQKLKMKDSGCCICAIACLDGRTPDVILNLLKIGNAINAQGLVIWDQAAIALNFIWKGFTTKPPKQPCLAMTNYYRKKGFPTHFVAWLGHDNLIIDPLTGSQLPNPYNIVNWRLFTKGVENG